MQGTSPASTRYLIFLSTSSKYLRFSCLFLLKGRPPEFAAWEENISTSGGTPTTVWMTVNPFFFLSSTSILKSSKLHLEVIPYHHVSASQKNELENNILLFLCVYDFTH